MVRLWLLDGFILANSTIHERGYEDREMSFFSKTTAPSKSRQRVAAAGVFLLALCLLTWGVIPLPRQMKRLDFLPADLPASLQPLVQGKPSSLQILSPAILRPGDPVEIELSFTAGQIQTAETRTSGGTYQVFARLEVQGAQLLSPPEILQSLIPGETITASWKLTAPDARPIQARIWFGISVLPEDASEGVHELLAAPVIDINRDGQWLPGGSAARVAGLGLFAALLAAYVRSRQLIK